jgi:hypothetical protein
MFNNKDEKAALSRAVQKFKTFSRRVPQILSEQAKSLYKIAIFHIHCFEFEIVLKSLFDVVDYLHKAKLKCGMLLQLRRSMRSYEILVFIGRRCI